MCSTRKVIGQGLISGGSGDIEGLIFIGRHGFVLDHEAHRLLKPESEFAEGRFGMVVFVRLSARLDVLSSLDRGAGGPACWNQLSLVDGKCG